ncbi:MAG: YhbY family RNA-binding protein [Archaeoglobaceae archaeon]
MEKVNTINAGKNGLTENLIGEINSRLEKHGTVKVRMLRSFRNEDKKRLADEIASNVNGKLVDIRGFVITLKRC